MNCCTPNTLSPYEILALADGRVFVWCRPILDGLEDPSISLLFVVNNGEAAMVRQFDWPMNGLAFNRGALCTVDEENMLYRLRVEGWEEIEDAEESPPAQIIVLHAHEDQLLGITPCGTLHEWTGSSWKDIATDEDETFLYDIETTNDGQILVCGDDGFIARVEDDKFATIEPGTTARLIDLLSLDEGVFVTGSGGVAFRLDGEEARFVNGLSKDVLYNAVLFDGEILIAAEDEVLRVTDNFETVVHSSGKVQRLEAMNGNLWRLGSEISRWDDEANVWRGIPITAEVVLD